MLRTVDKELSARMRVKGSFREGAGAERLRESAIIHDQIELHGHALSFHHFRGPPPSAGRLNIQYPRAASLSLLFGHARGLTAV